LSYEDEALWKYQRFMEDYLRCVASVDDNVGRVIDFLRERGELDDTILIYASDQGFFLGDHGWFDKRFMYEESLRMPLLLSYPRAVTPGVVCPGADRTPTRPSGSSTTSKPTRPNCATSTTSRPTPRSATGSPRRCGGNRPPSATSRTPASRSR
jgi:hypothetical protein